MASIIPPSNTLRQQCRWYGYPTTDALEQAVALTIFHSAQQSIQQRGAFHLVLAGGTAPRRVYELLSTMKTNWNEWHIYYGDERCLPADHAERNSRMAAQGWLDQVSIPSGQIHPIPAERGAEAGASAYAQTLSQVEMFDMVILGLGEDGHTASLFPDHEWGTPPNAPATLAVHNAPKPPSNRVSLSAHRLSQTRQLVFLVTGSTKLQAIKDWRAGNRIPAAAIAPAVGVDIYLEDALLTE